MTDLVKHMKRPPSGGLFSRRLHQRKYLVQSFSNRMQPIEQSLAIFLVGATGDLSRKKILKAIYHLFQHQLLPSQFSLIGTARRDFSRSQFHDFVHTAVEPKDEQQWREFCEHVYFVPGDVHEPETFHKIKTLYQSLDQCANNLWYVATLPQLYVDAVRNIKAAGLHETVYGWTKLLIEKPFGTHLASAKKLNEELLQVFSEDSIYRIDHFLGKETVQNLLAFRFANGVFEHLWNWKYVDHIQVTSSETLGVGGRIDFYDQTGAVRDIFQNHILQMIAMTLMEEPNSLKPEHIDIRRKEFLASLRPLTDTDIAENVRFGQYTAGESEGVHVSGYLEEAGVPANSTTETAFACKMFSDTDRWQGVPIYVRLGKRMAKKITEITIQFKEPFNKMFGNKGESQGNILTLRIAPNEGIIFTMKVKKPGLALDLQDVPMQFYYKHTFQMDLLEAYVKLLYDAIQGDTTLFPRATSIELSWKFIEPILQQKMAATFKPEVYPAGSWGPKSFEELITKDGRKWY